VTFRGREYDEIVARTLKTIGLGVFEHPYVALPGALNTMAVMAQHYNIAIVTKGEDTEQRKKVFDSGCFIYADHVIPVSKKDTADWERVVDNLRIPFNNRVQSWAIGNSVKSDINPHSAWGSTLFTSHRASGALRRPSMRRRCFAVALK
jgi:putative hydrolase of the HAD superfamily